MTKLRDTDNGSVLFECPGCDSLHVVHLTTPGYPHWAFNGNYERPTFSPSLHVSWDRISTGDKHICHSFIRDGKIEFLNDCTHSLAGKTVDIPDWNDDDKD